MNIYKFELKVLSKSIITWSLTIFVVLMLFMSMYPTFSSDAAMLDQIMENYPEELLKMVGMTGGLSMSSVLGFFVFVFGFMQLFLAIQASNYGFSILSIEERELTADFLLSKPISRKTIFLYKFMAAFTGITITNIVLWASSILSLVLFAGDNTYDSEKLVLFLSCMILFQLFFLGVGMIISVSVKKVRSVLSFSMALSFGLYIMNGIRSIIGGELLGILTPFYHFEPGKILDTGNLNLPMTVLSIFAIVCSLVGSYILYMKRNIHSL